MKKLFYIISVFSVSAGLILMSGCDLFGPEDPDEDAVTISIDAIGTIAAGDYKVVGGDVEANVVITALTASILNSDQTAYTGTAITIQKQAVSGEDKIDLSDDADLRIITTASAVSGTYYLKIEATAGTATASELAEFTVTGGVTVHLDTTEVTLGSWDNDTYGSSLDADEMVVYKVSQVTAAIQPEIDIWFSNQGGGGTWLMTPTRAAEQGHAPDGWTNKSTDIELMEVTGDADLASVETQDDIDAIWAANVVDAGDYVDVVEGDVVIVKTNNGVYRLLHVLDVVDANDGTAVILGVREVQG